MFEHTQDQNVRVVASKIVDLSAAHLILVMTIKIVIWPEAWRNLYTRFSFIAINVCVPRCLQSESSSASRRPCKSNIQKWTESQWRPADDVTPPNITSAVSLKDFHMFHVFVISLLLLFFFCSTERFLPLLCNVTLIISLSEKAAVDNANDIYSFCLMTRSLGFPWRSSSSVLSLWDLSLPVCFFLLFSIFIASRSFFHSLYDDLPRRPPSLQRDGQIVVWTEAS